MTTLRTRRRTFPGLAAGSALGALGLSACGTSMAQSVSGRPHFGRPGSRSALNSPHPRALCVGRRQLLSGLTLGLEK